MRHAICLAVCMVALSILAMLTPMANSQQSITITPIMDAYVDNQNPNTNFGQKDELIVANVKLNESKHMIINTYLKFNLSALPENAKILSASMTINVFWFDTKANLYVHYCPDTTWEEGSITWSNAPKYDNETLATVPIAATGEQHINLTSALKKAWPTSKLLTIVLTAQEIAQAKAMGIQFDARTKSTGPKVVISFEAPVLTQTATSKIQTTTASKTQTKTGNNTLTTALTTALTNTQITLTNPQVAAPTPPYVWALGGILALLIAIIGYRLSRQAIKGTRGVAPGPEEVEEEEPKLRCPYCDDPLEYISQYDRYYCWNCKKYMPKGYPQSTEQKQESSKKIEEESLEEWYKEHFG